jgi:hypothetical protein
MRLEARRAGGKGGSLPGWLLPLITGILGLALGLTYAWVISPVQYTNAHPGQLSPGAQEEWITMTADSYSLNQDLGLAQRRLQAQFFAPDELAALLGQEIVTAQQSGDLAAEQRLQALAQALAVQPGSPAGQSDAAAPVPQGETSNRLGSLLMLCGGGLLALLLLGVVAIAFTRIQQARAGGFRGGGQRPASPARASKGEKASAPAREVANDADADEALDRFMDEPEDEDEAEEPAREVQFVPLETGPARYSPALGEFVTRYNYGDDGYDMSFSIETSQTEFLGECGVGISDTLNDGSPQQVSAFEIWLFDKDDIRTVTKVLLSEYAWNSEELRSRLTPKGELILAREGDTIDLETKSLRVRARIREVEYGNNGPADSAYFERLVVELTPQQKG